MRSLEDVGDVTELFNSLSMVRDVMLAAYQSTRSGLAGTGMGAMISPTLPSPRKSVP